jgi:ABC-type multidrug transport system ATPase subunit
MIQVMAGVGYLNPAAAVEDGRTNHNRGSAGEGTLRAYRVSFIVKKDDGSDLHILRHVSLEIGPGVTAVMGPSGCGKTTCLDLFAGRLLGGRIDGHVFYDDVNVLNKRNTAYVSHNSGYVMQLATPWDEKLTLRQNLIYEAELRFAQGQHVLSLGGTAVEAVEKVIEMLDMQLFADTVVGGSSGGGGLSGGQKRKLSTAIQLLVEPQFLFLDEPTSGLDAGSTLALLKQLRALGDAGKTILITIHQPRIEVWEMFHHVLVLARGQVCYHGVPSKAKRCGSGTPLFVNSDACVNTARLHTHMPLECSSLV